MILILISQNPDCSQRSQRTRKYSLHCTGRCPAAATVHYHRREDKSIPKTEIMLTDVLYSSPTKTTTKSLFLSILIFLFLFFTLNFLRYFKMTELDTNIMSTVSMKLRGYISLGSYDCPFCSCLVLDW